VEKEKESGTERIIELAQKAGLDGFLVSLLGMILLAYIWPFPGTEKSPVPLGMIASVGVSFIFFFYGLRLSPQKLKAGLSNWRLHVLIQFATFFLFPLLAFLVRPFFAGEENQILWLAIFFLMALPSTVSSSVVMVSIAGGNIPGAIFNASISSLLGVFITPVWMGVVLDGGPGEFDFTAVVGKLALQVLFPVALGISLNKKWGEWAERQKKYIRLFDQATILLIVYTSFCESFDNDLFSEFSMRDLLFLGAGMLALFFVIFKLLQVFSRMLNFSRQDEITAVFCGSKKSLIQGAVMAKVLFSGGANAGIMLLPIMLYHALQLIAASSLAQRFSRYEFTEKE
jgi:sodium/bile acid cotransporter 7